MELKKVYTPEELDDLVAWMKAHLDAVPQTLTIYSGMTTSDLPLVIRNYIDIVELHRENPTYGGQISHLFRIREVLQEQGMV